MVILVYRPRKLCCSLPDPVTGNDQTASILSGFGEIPCKDMTNPKNSTKWLENFTFQGFNFRWPNAN